MVPKGIGSGRVGRTMAVAAGLGVAAAVFFLRRADILVGIPAVLLAVLLIFFLPLSSSLSRRIALGGALFLGWVPLLWWVRLPVPEVDRLGILLALAWGCAVAWTLWGPGVRTRARRLLPTVASADAIPFAAAGIATWTMWPLIASSGGQGSLNVLVKMGWDHAAHLGMAFTARIHGAITPFLGQAPDGSPWVWGDYPQHFHATVTAFTELYSGPAFGGIATEVLRYGRSLALVLVIIVTLLAAGVAQLPNLRRRPLLAWPAAALAIAAFLFGPGSWALSKAFPNFVSTCVAVGLIVLLAMGSDRRVRALDVFAIGGLVVATVHGWVLLVPLAVVGCVVAVVPYGRDRWPSALAGRAKVGAALALTVLASGMVVPILMGSGAVGALGVSNDILPSGAMKLPYVLPAGGVALAAGLAAFVRKQSPEASQRGVVSAAVPATGFVLLGALGVYLYATGGDVSYYFDKLLVGVGLVSVVVLVACAELHVGPRTQLPGKVRRVTAVFAGLVAAVAVLPVFGLNGLDARDHANELTNQRAPAVERILSSAELSQSRPFGSTVYLAAETGDISPTLAYQWNRALTDMWAYGSGVDSTFPAKGMTTVEAAGWVVDVLEADRERFVIMAPEVATAVRALVPTGYSDRVLSW